MQVSGLLTVDYQVENKIALQAEDSCSMEDGENKGYLKVRTSVDRND